MKSPKSVKLHKFVQSSVVILITHMSTLQSMKKKKIKIQSKHVSQTFYTILPFELFSSRNSRPSPHSSTKARARVELGGLGW